MKRVLLALVLCSFACTEKPKAGGPAAPLQKPAPLEPLVAERTPVDAGPDTEATYTVKRFDFAGAAIPAAALRLDVIGFTLKADGEATSLEALAPKLTAKTVALLRFDADTYVAQILPLLAALDDARAQVLLQSPDVPTIAWPVKLRDEASFNVWLDDGVAGKLRIIQRADGFELQTNMGKLPGGDPKGPTVPTRGGAIDLVTLQKGLDRVKQRFTEAPDVCFMPSYGTSLNDAIRAVATNWIAKDKVVFANVCLVYARPAADAGR